MTSKTHHFDDSVILDSPDRRWLSQALLRLVRTLRPDDKVFTDTAERLRKRLAIAANEWGLENWQVTTYVLRHTGPSHDHLSKRRSLPEIKRRGRWANDRSVRRYEKAALINSRLASLPPGHLAPWPPYTPGTPASPK